MAFDSFPKSWEASQVLALPPSMPAGWLQERDAAGHGEGPRQVHACLAGDKRGHSMGGGYTTPRLSASWSLLEFGERKERPQLRRDKGTSPLIPAFFSMERHQSKP